MTPNGERSVFLRSGGGLEPSLELIDPDPTLTVGNPSSSRLTDPGCWAWIVRAPGFSEVIVFRAVIVTHYGQRGAKLGWTNAEKVETGIVSPNDIAEGAPAPQQADCAKPLPEELASKPFGNTRLPVFSCVISYAEQSGTYLVQVLPKTDLPADMEFAVDQLVEFAMPNGQTLAGRILEIGDDAVKVDFNHPLADLSIEFEVEIVRIL